MRPEDRNASFDAGSSQVPRSKLRLQASFWGPNNLFVVDLIMGEVTEYEVDGRTRWTLRDHSMHNDSDDDDDKKGFPPFPPLGRHSLHFVLFWFVHPKAHPHCGAWVRCTPSSITGRANTQVDKALAHHTCFR
jgi:hypothetical protein